MIGSLTSKRYFNKNSLGCVHWCTRTSHIAHTMYRVYIILCIVCIKHSIHTLNMQQFASIFRHCFALLLPLMLLLLYFVSCIILQVNSLVYFCCHRLCLLLALISSVLCIALLSPACIPLLTLWYSRSRAQYSDCCCAVLSRAELRCMYSTRRISHKVHVQYQAQKDAIKVQFSAFNNNIMWPEY